MPDSDLLAAADAILARAGHTLTSSDADVVPDADVDATPEVDAAPATPPPPAVEPEPPVDDVTPQAIAWADIKKKERALLDERRAFKAEQEAFSSSKKGHDDLRARLQSDPHAVLQELGVFNTLADQLEGKKPTKPVAPQEKVDPEKDAIRQELQEFRQWRAQETARGYRATLAAELAKPDYALLAANPHAVDEMFAYVMQYANAYGQDAAAALTPAEIAGTIQDVWREELTNLRTSNAVLQVFGSSSDAKPSTPPAPKTQKPAATKPAPAAAPSDDDQPLSDYEELRRAAALVTQG